MLITLKTLFEAFEPSFEKPPAARRVGDRAHSAHDLIV
jgi:hypothetical protein